MLSGLVHQKGDVTIVDILGKEHQGKLLELNDHFAKIELNEEITRVFPLSSVLFIEPGIKESVYEKRGLRSV